METNVDMLTYLHPKARKRRPIFSKSNLSRWRSPTPPEHAGCGQSCLARVEPNK